MSRKSRQAHNWFAGWRRAPRSSASTSRSVEEQEFFVLSEESELPPRGYGVGYGQGLDLDVERFEQPEFSGRALGEKAGARRNGAAVQEPPLVKPPRPLPLKRRLHRGVQAKLKSGRQVAWSGAKQAGRFARGQAGAAYDRFKPYAREHRWSLLSYGLLMTASLTAVAAMVLISRVPEATKCEKINILSSDSERLFCAQQAAQTGDPEQILAAIALVKGWNKDNPLYTQGNAALGQWSELLLIEARDRLSNNDLDGAIKLAQQIPSSSPVFQQAQDEMNFWQVERNRGQQLFEKIQVALRKQLWNDASGYLVKMSQVNDATWQGRLPNLRKQLSDEKEAGQFLVQAQKFVEKNSVEKYGEAIRMLLPMNRQTFVWEAAQKQLNQWRDRVLERAAKDFAKQDVTGATKLIASLPREVALTDTQRDLVRVASAAAVGGSKQSDAPFLNQLWGVMVADTAARQVAPTSAYYKQAQQLRPQLAQQSQDAAQIQLARSLAAGGQLTGMQWAMQQVEAIATNRPRRLDAQTHLATWRKQLQALEDRPIVKQAELLAQAGGIDQLRSAVNIIERLPKGRSLYTKAQSQKAEWVAQIQTIEDKPILNEARSVAQAGKLGQAIQIASRIKAGRALYGDAQGDIGAWAGELQAIADRERLAQAQALAAQGSLTRAIGVAAQISSGAVSDEAQQSISRWSAEREEIRRSAPPEPVSAPADPVEQAQRGPEPVYDPLAPADPVEQPSAPVPTEPVYEPPAPVPAAVDPLPPADPVPPQ